MKTIQVHSIVKYIYEKMQYYYAKIFQKFLLYKNIIRS